MATQTPAKIMGLYGLPGVGKTTLLNLLKKLVPHDSFAFYEGSEMVANAASGSLDTFRSADDNTKTLFRAQAIANIAGECTASGKTGIVTGHYSFLNASTERPNVVLTTADTRHYTHIIYLSASGEEIEQRCRHTSHARVALTAAEIKRWAVTEVEELRRHCYSNQILLAILRIEQMSPTNVAEAVASLVQRFPLQSPGLNEQRVTIVVNDFLSKQSATLRRVLMFDGAKTLCDEDAAGRLWRKYDKASNVIDQPANAVYKFVGYSRSAYSQAAQLYRELGPSDFAEYCAEVAADIHVVLELRSILAVAKHHDQIAVVVVTSGLRRIWETALSGLVKDVNVVGDDPFDEVGSDKLLGTPTRDATGHGPSLRKAHQQIGQYLAIEYVSDVLGLAKHSITNVHGQRDVGHCLTKEDRTMIVPLMRSGEPMAMGVNDVFPQAVFFHAKNPADLRPEYLDQCEAVTLVDSVINSGASIAEFVTHVRARRGSMSIVVVTSVVRAHAVRPGGPVRNMALKNEVAIVALRLSDKKYTGKGVTDTGARLFNTTALE
ncbi:hypothetical protein B0A48_14615 [Cryoendolithus antarcticus]|uniref:Phosphoribosyltransferase domain-containing protein n=1 Tax=Cryoendolithus antarcticus TaxID=1507870 RepID=A0A1V8SL08_9PEZI|nr:hypothetical protein B0A48_14615 [Cryoendolithus antarcticus]